MPDRKRHHMDTVRTFKTLAKQQLKEQRARGSEHLSLQQVQHVLAQEAGFTNWSSLLSADDFDRRLALLLRQWPQLTSAGMDGTKGAAVSDREWLALTPEERASKYANARASLRSETAAIRWVHDWLIENVAPTKNLNQMRTSYGLKHLAEHLRGEYLTNGAFIAGALLAGFTSDVTTPDQLARNVHFNMSQRDIQLEERRRDALRDGRPAPSKPARVSEDDAPFHAWLMRQVRRDDPIGDLARDYAEGVRRGEHDILPDASAAVEFFSSIISNLPVYDVALAAVSEWFQAEPDAAPVRTAQIGSSSADHSGWGAGAGTTERITSVCPCGEGTVIEEHENTPGFREHDAWIDCDRCRSEWSLDKSRGASGWVLRPTVIVAR